jgi:hypothetical protein
MMRGWRGALLALGLLVAGAAIDKAAHFQPALAAYLRCIDLPLAGTACEANTGTSGGVLGFLNGLNVYSAFQSVGVVSLTAGSSIAVNALLGNAFTVTTSANSETLANPTGIATGFYSFAIVNGGGYTGFATGTDYHFPGNVTPTWSTTSGDVDVITCFAYTTTRLECTALIND